MTTADTPVSGLAPRIAEIERRIRAVTDGLSAEALLWRPDPKKWSLAEVFEHLHRFHTLYNRNIGRALAEAGPAPAHTPLRPSPLARALDWLAGSRVRVRVPAPPFFKPREASPASPDRFLADWAAFRESVAAAEGRDLGVRVRLPVRVLTLRLGEVLPVVTGHAERHLAQAEAVRGAPGFPG